MKLVEKGEVKDVIIKDLTRLSRNVVDSITILQTFKLNKCGLVSYQESIKIDTAIEKYIYHIKIANAEFESDNTSERTLIGLDGKDRKGLYPYGNSP